MMKSVTFRLVPIMLLKLPIMLWSNAPESSQPNMLKLCSICKPVFSTNSKFPFSYHLAKSQKHEYQQFVFTYFPNTVQFCLSCQFPYSLAQFIYVHV